MKNDQREQGHAPTSPGEAGRKPRDEHRAKNAVQEPVMIPRVELRRSVTGQLAGDVHDQTEAINVRQEAGQGDEAAITRVVRRFRCDDPTGQKMGEGGHLKARGVGLVPLNTQGAGGTPERQRENGPLAPALSPSEGERGNRRQPFCESRFMCRGAFICLPTA